MGTHLLNIAVQLQYSLNSTYLFLNSTYLLISCSDYFPDVWLNKVLGFASWKLRGVVSAKDQCTPAVVGAPTPLGQRHSETTQTTELTNASIDEESKRRATFQNTKNRETKGSSQCQGVRSSCTGQSTRLSWTAPFRDDTDNRSGGCTYQWMIQSSGAYRAGFNMCQVCFRETEGSSQSQRNRHSCRRWTTVDYPAFTDAFRDDTDNRSGGCLYSWYLDCKYSADVAKQHQNGQVARMKYKKRIKITLQLY